MNVQAASHLDESLEESLDGLIYAAPLIVVQLSQSLQAMWTKIRERAGGLHETPFDGALLAFPELRQAKPYLRLPELLLSRMDPGPDDVGTLGAEIVGEAEEDGVVAPTVENVFDRIDALLDESQDILDSAAM